MVPVFHPARHLANATIEILDDIGGAQTPLKELREAYMLDRERLLKPLPERGNSAWMFFREAAGQPLESSESGLVRLAGVGLSHCLANAWLKLLGKMPYNVSHLVDLAPLHNRTFAKDQRDCLHAVRAL